MLTRVAPSHVTRPSALQSKVRLLRTISRTTEIPWTPQALPSTWAKVASEAQTATKPRWAAHGLGLTSARDNTPAETEIGLPVRRFRASRFAKKLDAGAERSKGKAPAKTAQEVAPPAPEVTATAPATAPAPVEPPVAANVAATEAPLEKKAEPKKRRTLRPRKALITLTPKAVANLRGLLDQPEPQLIRIGVRNRGCLGLTYHLEYVSEPGKFDETVEQDGVKVLIDLKALFSIVGLEMDWVDDKLSARFIFRNPNSKGTCGCGESFMV